MRGRVLGQGLEPRGPAPRPAEARRRFQTFATTTTRWRRYTAGLPVPPLGQLPMAPLVGSFGVACSCRYIQKLFSSFTCSLTGFWRGLHVQEHVTQIRILKDYFKVRFLLTGSWCNQWCIQVSWKQLCLKSDFNFTYLLLTFLKGVFFLPKA